MKYKPSAYVSWIHHLKNYDENITPVAIGNDCIQIKVHPSHPELVINNKDDLYLSVDKEDKTKQLYFYSLAWFIPLLMYGSEEELIASLGLIDGLLNIDNDKTNSAWNMLWDDHAISERLCVLIEIKKALNLTGELSAKIENHLKLIYSKLSLFFSDSRWDHNNHRLFHFFAAYVYFDYLQEVRNRERCKKLFEDFVISLIDLETGFSREQSLAYCTFDLNFIKNIYESFYAIEQNSSINIGDLYEKLNHHLVSLSFPDGVIPASGDTVCGGQLSSIQKKIFINEPKLYWKNLDGLGYFRGASENGIFHFLMISHNAESGHGHFSPSHFDLWVRDFGVLLTDCGGPYKYGDKLRYDWFKSAKGHNSLYLEGGGCLNDIDVRISEKREWVKSFCDYTYARHQRDLFSSGAEFFLHESVFSKEKKWSISYNFAENITICKLSEGLFELKNENSKKILLETNFPSSSISLEETFRCIGHSKKISAPSLIFHGDMIGINWCLNFKIWE